MKILVIDDNQTNLDVAKAQLSGKHEVTTAQTYDDARLLLGGERIGYTGCEPIPANVHPFEVVLVDLLMPASNNKQGKGKYLAGTEMPIGIFLALLAARNGAKYVLILTDSGHHDHPASACFDSFNFDSSGYCAGIIPLAVAGAKLVLCNDTNLVRTFFKDDPTRAIDWRELREFNSEEHIKEITVQAKDWERALELLLKQKS